MDKATITPFARLGKAISISPDKTSVRFINEKKGTGNMFGIDPISTEIFVTDKELELFKIIPPTVHNQAGPFIEQEEEDLTDLLVQELAKLKIELSLLRGGDAT